MSCVDRPVIELGSATDRGCRGVLGAFAQRDLCGPLDLARLEQVCDLRRAEQLERREPDGILVRFIDVSTCCVVGPTFSLGSAGVEVLVDPRWAISTGPLPG